MDPECYPAGRQILLREAQRQRPCTLSERKFAISSIEFCKNPIWCKMDNSNA